jgi:hypothetical protein
MSRIADLYRKAKQIYHTDGFVSLVRRGFAFLLYCFFEYRTYYIYMDHLKDLPDLDGADFLPRIGNFTLKLVSSNEEADSLEVEGLEFRSQVPYARDALDRGATASCIFVGHQLVHIGWVATTQQAKDSLNEPPFTVDFSRNQSCSGGVWTSPQYRRTGLFSYSLLKRYEFLRDKGITANLCAVAETNVSAQMGYGGSVPTPCAEGRYLRVLWWKWWREKRLPQG